MWEPQPPATLRASTACTGITLPFTVKQRYITNEKDIPVLISICLSFLAVLTSYIQPDNINFTLLHYVVVVMCVNALLIIALARFLLLS
jgi:hypothetical protein